MNFSILCDQSLIDLSSFDIARPSVSFDEEEYLDKGVIYIKPVNFRWNPIKIGEENALKIKEQLGKSGSFLEMHLLGRRNGTKDVFTLSDWCLEGDVLCYKGCEYHRINKADQ